jgi:carboxypeptidase T
MKQLIWSISLAALLSTGTLWAQTQTPVHLVQVDITTPGTMENLLLMGLDIPAPPSPDGWLQVIVDDQQFDMLIQTGYRVEELIHHLQQFYANRLGARPMGNYMTYSEVVAAMDTVHAHYPNITTDKFSIGQSWEGRDLWVMKVSDNPNIDEEEPELFFHGNIHAREVITYTMLIYTLEHLTDAYGVDTMITRLIDTHELFIAPTVNPDGLVYNEITAPNGGGMWRKNRRDNGGGIYGVDCNRNYDWRWGYDNYGSSPDPSSSTYRGPAPFSEPETQALRDFCISRQFCIITDNHSYGNYHLYPWSGDYDGYTPDHPDFVAIANGMAIYTSYQCGCPWELLYNVNGGSIDWYYGEQTMKNKSYGLVSEIGSSGDGFWPPAYRIEPLCNENYLANLHLLNIVHLYCPDSTDIRFQYVTIDDAAGNANGIPDPGETINMDVVVKNLGMCTAIGVSGTLTESDPYADILVNTALFGNIGPNQLDSTQTPFRFTINSSCPILHHIEFTLQVTTTQGYSADLPIIVTVGERETYFSTDFESGVQDWTHSGASGWTDQWHLSTQRSNSPTHSWKCGDTGTGTYANHMDARLESPWLPLHDHPQLKFWHWMESEISSTYPDSAYDGGIVEVSLDGSTWAHVEPDGGYPKTTRYSAGGGNPYSGPFAGTPCYAGSFDWQEAVFDLEDLAGDSLKIRFRFGTDDAVGNEGWYVDDVTLLGVPETAVPPVENFTITLSGNDIILNWISGGTQDGYRVYRSNSPDGPFTQIWQGTNTTYIDIDALNHNTYFYYVTAYAD